MAQDQVSKDFIRYDLLVQDALRGVVRKVLTDAAVQGLPGDHHFFISFRTKASGVKVSSRLHERHPEEMTIVLQHQFWDLIVSETGFEVGLSFGGVAEKLVIPFDAMTGFWDRSVDFGLKFELAGVDAADNDSPDSQSNMAPIVSSYEQPPAAANPAVVDAQDTDNREGGAEIVSLNAFRKKP